jgi:glycosyltransferase involved in cell wall biosynthesis
MKVALIHEHLAQDGGAENVLRVFHEIFPDAPIFTLVYDRQRANPVFRTADIRTSFIQKLPFGVRLYQAALPFMATAVEKFDLSEFDVVLSSASGFAKGVITVPQTLHICYCHSPTRYLWSDTHRYYKELRYSRLVRAMIPFALTRIRQWDRAAADRVDLFIANSRYVQNRIKKYYKAGSTVIFPPVEVNKFRVADEIDDYYLTLGRLVAYKRYDLTIKAFNKLGRPLKVAGDGPELPHLRKIAGPNIEFLGRVSEETRRDLFMRCQAFVHPQEEDWGITPVEAMASGRPVIAYGRGGALETIKDGQTGLLFKQQTVASLIEALNRFRSYDFNPAEIRRHALQFDSTRFKREIKDFVTKAWCEFSRK